MIGIDKMNMYNIEDFFMLLGFNYHTYWLNYNPKRHIHTQSLLILISVFHLLLWISVFYFVFGQYLLLWLVPLNPISNRYKLVSNYHPIIWIRWTFFLVDISSSSTFASIKWSGGRRRPRSSSAIKEHYQYLFVPVLLSLL